MSGGEKVRVLQVTHDLGVGGLPRVVATLVRHLDRERFDVSVLCLNDKGPLAEDVEAAGVPVLLLPGPKDRPDYLAFRRVRRVIRERGIEVLHTHNTQPFIDAGLAGLLAGVRTHVHTDHARDFPDKRRYMLAERALSRIAYRVVGVSEDTCRKLARWERIPPERMSVIHNGIEGDRFDIRIDRRAKRAEIGIPPDVPVVGVAVRLSEQKGLEYLLRALPAVHERFPGTVAVIAGEGPLEDDLRRLSRELGVVPHVRFLGVRADVAELLQVFDVYALPSLWEGLPMVVLEAMAAGVPIVAAEVGGVPEAVVQGRTGVLVPPRRPDALAAALVGLLGDPDRRRSYGAAARRRFRERFSAETMARGYEALYLRRAEEASVDGGPA